MHTDGGTTLNAPARAGEEFTDDARVLKRTAAGSVRMLLPTGLLLERTRLGPRRSTWATQPE